MEKQYGRNKRFNPEGLDSTLSDFGYCIGSDSDRNFAEKLDMTIKEASAHPDVKIIDVRSFMEFQSAHVPGSVNIPLNEIPAHLNELMDASMPLVFCCASGNRSGQAVYFLQDNGVRNAINGGGWMNVQFELSQLQAI